MKKIDNIIIVLGHVNENEELLSEIAKSRAEAAFALSKKLAGENNKFLLTGGANELTRCKNQPHALYIQDQLRKLGVSKDQIIPEHAESSNTLEDAEFAKPIIETYADKSTRLYIVTSEFHTARAKITFRKIFGDDWQILTHSDKNGVEKEESKALKENEAEKIQRYLPELPWISILTQKELAGLGEHSSKLRNI